jgi:membrane-associated phospholipid phosphatase
MAVAAGAVAIAGLETPLGWTTALLLPLIGWARWRDGRHSVGQLIGGAIIGALAAATIYSLLT